MWGEQSDWTCQSWSSSNTSVATVNDGLVTGVGAGTSIITVRTQDGNKVASCAVTVASPTPIPAGEGDHFFKNEGALVYTSNQVRASVTARNHVRVFPNLFQIRVGNILYDLVDANTVYNEDSINWKTLLAERYGSQETIIGKIEEELAGKIILVEVEDSSKVERIIFNGRVLNSDVWEYAINGNLVRIPINEEIEKVIITIDRVDYRVVLFE